jgi:hypothetical protein
MDDPMRQGMQSSHWRDELGNPAGGCAYGTGFCISWQNGPLGRGLNRLEANGAFVEDILRAAADRLLFYQESKFACKANDDAVTLILQALDVLNQRTAEREKRGVEGTHQL